MWYKIKYLTGLENNNSDDYCDKCMNIKFESNNNLLLRKKLKLDNVMIIINSNFYGSNKYYPVILSNECLYKLAELLVLLSRIFCW